MMSHCSDNLHTLITFQGEELWMQVTRIAQWTKSQWAHSVIYQAKGIWQLRIGYNGSLCTISLLVAILTLGELWEAILTPRRVQFRVENLTPPLHSSLLPPLFISSFV